MPTYYVDYEGGNDANTGVDFANRWKTINSGATAARIAPGDTIRVMASPDPTSLGISATWTNLSPTVTLASALNVLVTNCDSAWTASPNVTCAANTTTYRTSTGSASAAFAGAFTTGLAAYLGLGGAQDYSAYQGLTFWVHTNTAIAASTLSLRLCSDAVGAVTVDTIAIPALPVINAWVPVYVDTGGALGASIQSIALYADADPGTATVLLDNISTVKASGSDNLNLTSLIGKNTGSEHWWALRSINGTTVTLDNAPGAASGSTPKGYVGTSESVTTYKRTTVKIAMTSSAAQPVQDSGSSGNLITFSCGWNRSDMSTQTGQTYWDGQCGTGTGWDFNLQTFVSVDRLFTVRYSIGVLCGPADNVMGTIGGIACTNNALSVGSAALRCSVASMTATQGTGSLLSLLGSAFVCTSAQVHGAGETVSQAAVINGRGIKLGTIEIKNFGGTCVSLGGAATNNISFTSLTLSNATTGITTSASLTDFLIQALTCTSISGVAITSFGGLNVRFNDVTVTSCGTALSLPAGFVNGSLILGSLTTTGNTTVISFGAFTGNVYVNESSFAEVSPLSFSGSGYTSGRVVFQDYNGAAGDHRTYYSSGASGATVFADSTTRHSSSGLSWKFNIQSTTFVTSDFPVTFPVARIAVNANKQVTASIWTRRSSTSMVGTFRARGGQLDGVPSDVTSSSSAAINTWQQLQLVFTPTETGVMDLDFTVYGVTSEDLFIHDFTVVQAP